MASRVFTVLVALSVVTAFAACDDPSAPLARQSPVPEASASDPAAREAATANPAFDQGNTVHITKAGLQPVALTSFCCNPVVFKNETGGSVTVIFNIGKKSSGPIAPGANWQWTPPNPESVLYHLGSDPKESGQIQVESPNW